MVAFIISIKNYYEKNGKESRILNTDLSIPSSWTFVHLGKLFDVVSASRVHQSDWRTAGVPFYRAREIARLSEFGHVNNELFISEELFNKLSRNGVPRIGDIMITAVGTLGKTYIVKKNDRFYYKDASVISLKNLYNLDPNYFSLLFSSPYLLEQIRENVAGTTVGTITIEKAKKYIIPLPPSEEQSRIFKKIQSINCLINS